jgi:hypothetical protein
MQIKSQSIRWERGAAPPEDWRNLISGSTNEDEVVAMVRDHLARYSPQEIARLPEECRPPRIRDAEDVSRWAFELARTHCAQSGDDDNETVLERMLEFVTQAAQRLSELKATAPETDNVD